MRKDHTPCIQSTWENGQGCYYVNGRKAVHAPGCANAGRDVLVAVLYEDMR